MKVSFQKGYSIYKKKNNGIFIVCPHSGPAFERVTSRDDNSETVASLCFKKFGGVLIVSNIPRTRLWGVDFNREVPSIKDALKMFEIFRKRGDMGIRHEYRKKYAWVAKDREDYENRLSIYQNFWGEVSKGKKIVFIHRAFPRIKVYPSIMDIVTFGGKGVNKNLMRGIISKVNSKYYEFFRSVEKSYKNMILFEGERNITDILQIYKTFDVGVLKGPFKNHMLKDLKIMRQYANSYVFKRLNENFTPQNFLRCVRNALDNAPTPEITIEHIFSGELASGPKRKLFPNKSKVVIEIEPSRFLNFWHPEVTTEIVWDIIKDV